MQPSTAAAAATEDAGQAPPADPHADASGQDDASSD
jgi:hypothetical protein